MQLCFPKSHLCQLNKSSRSYISDPEDYNLNFWISLTIICDLIPQILIVDSKITQSRDFESFEDSMAEKRAAGWRKVNYHRDCGHTTLDPYAASNVPSELKSSSPYPDHYAETWRYMCESCSSGDSQPLVGVTLEQKAAEIRLLQDEEQKVLKQISERNDPLEEIVCNMAPETLAVSHARQIHTLYYQLSHITIYGDQVKQHFKRQDRLEKAMLGFSRSLLKELTVEERVYNLTILVERFGMVKLDFKDKFLNPYVEPTDEKEQQIATIDELQDEIDDQIQLQFELMEHNSMDDPKLREKWSETRRRFRQEKWEWSGFRIDLRYDSYDYSHSDSDDEGSFADSGFGLFPEDEI
jgi:hypothetical protein